MKGIEMIDNLSGKTKRVRIPVYQYKRFEARASELGLTVDEYVTKLSLELMKREP